MHDSQNIHEQLVREINRIYKDNKFSIKQKAISPYNTQNNVELFNEIRYGVAVFTNLINYTGGSVGDVNLYKLVQKYLISDEARAELNTVLKKY